MNEIMYAPETEIVDTVRIDYYYDGSYYHGTGVHITANAFQITGQFGSMPVYRFDRNTFTGAKILTNVSGTPGEAFRAWLASNATKQ